jgi:NitT/TauT family transport system permease protein
MKELFELRGDLDNHKKLIIQMAGVAFIIGVWWLITAMGLISQSLLPSPVRVITSYKELHFEDFLVRNLCYSIKLNLLGYMEALLISIPIGFVIGLFPLFKGLFNKPVDAFRFIPLTAVTGLFIAWFGIEDAMKVHFLAFGIIVYLLPVVIQRVYEVEKVYEQTVITLGANKWQTIKSVFIPSVLSKISVDIRVMVAISWTYIIVAELVNKSGGVGALAYIAARQSRIDKVFAILIVIVIVGFIQDKLFEKLDKLVFKYKYV